MNANGLPEIQIVGVKSKHSYRKAKKPGVPYPGLLNEWPLRERDAPH